MRINFLLLVGKIRYAWCIITMDVAEQYKRYTLDLFLEEASRIVRREKRRVYCNILITYPRIFDMFSRILERYNERRKSPWTVDITKSEEKDFFLVTFSSKYPRENPILLFWKVIRDDKYVTILSFSLEKYLDVQKCLDSLVKFVRGLWFAWLGSRFLENFDFFVRNVWDDAKVFASFQTIVEKGEILPRKMQVYPLPPREYIPLEDIRSMGKKRYLETGIISTFSRMRYSIISESRNIGFTFSITDRSKIMFEKGDFTLFITLLKPLVVEIRRILDILRRKSYGTEEETQILGKTVKIRSFDLIETLVFKKSEIAKNWYENIMQLFNSDIPESRLVNFTLMSGNPYFLVHVIDVENGSSVYLSATTEELRIVPAERYARETTIMKLIELLRTRIDPNIAVT